MDDTTDTQLNGLLKDILFKLFNQSEAKKKLPPMFQNSFMECSDNIQIARLIAYIIDSFFLRTFEPNTNNSTPLSFGENDSTEYENLEKQLQKYQAEVRQHIRNEQTMRLHCEQLEQQIQVLQRQNKKYKQPIKSQRLKEVSTQKTKNHKANHGENSLTQATKQKSCTKKRQSSRKSFHKKKTIEADTYRQSVSKNNIVSTSKTSRKSKEKKQFSNTQKLNNKHQKQHNILNEQLNFEAINARSQVVRSSRINSMRSTLPSGGSDSILKPNKSKHHNICSKKEY